MLGEPKTCRRHFLLYFVSFFICWEGEGGGVSDLPALSSTYALEYHMSDDRVVNFPTRQKAEYNRHTTPANDNTVTPPLP